MKKQTPDDSAYIWQMKYVKNTYKSKGLFVTHILKLRWWFFAFSMQLIQNTFFLNISNKKAPQKIAKESSINTSLSTARITASNSQSFLV